ncbi:MAG: transketolase family protein [Bdellovibrionales bacterium]|nr:transketolase family protein [Bdellovibrionales bacterium]
MKGVTVGLKETIIDGSIKAKASRASFGEELLTLGAQNADVVVLDADLSKSTMTYAFSEKYPERFFNMGIAEANMIGTAAGLAMTGKIPFAASFGCFLTGRFDQVRMSISFSGANVRLVGTHAGVSIGEDGHSQMALEDLMLMRCLPNMTVFQPADDQDTRDFMRWSLKHDGPCYMRLTRQNLPALRRMNGTAFAPGKWALLNEAPMAGGVVFLATGGVIEACVDAAEELSKSGHSVSVVNANWIKPLDEAFLLRLAAAKPALIMTVEDHYTVGGLGGAVAEFYADKAQALKVVRWGVQGFGQSGSPAATMDHYGLTGPKIAAAVSRELGAGR